MPIQIGDMTLYTVKDLSKILSVSERTIRTYIRDGHLKGKKIARRWFVPDASVRDYFKDLETEESPPPPQPDTPPQEQVTQPPSSPAKPSKEQVPEEWESDIEQLIKEAERLKREAERVEKLYGDTED